MSELTAKMLEDQVGALHIEIKKDIETANEKSVQGVHDKIDKQLKEEIGAKLDALTEKNTALQGHYDAMQVKMEKAEKQGSFAGKKPTALGNELGEKLKAFGNLKDAYSAGKLKNLDFENLNGKAVGTMTSAASLTGEVIQADYRPSIVGIARRKQHIRPLFNQGSMSSDTFRFIKEVAGEGGAGVTAEAAKKNQADVDFATTDAPVRKLSAFTDISEELLSDFSALQSFLPSMLQNKIRLVEDTQLLSGAGTGSNLTGITSGASAFAAWAVDSNAQSIDVFMQAMAQLEGINYEASGLLLNPKDWTIMYNSKSTTGEYLRGLAFDNVSGNLTLLGMPIYKSTAVTLGDYFIGDWANGAMIMDRMGLNVRFSDQNNDNFEKNIITIVAEERLAFPIFRADSFIKGTILTDIAKIADFT